MLQSFVGIFLPFVGTILGSSVVFLLKDKINERLEKLLLGFASGVMLAASVWSLLIPSMEMVDNLKWLPACVGFVLGVGFLFLLDCLVPHKHKDSDCEEGISSSISDINKFMLAVTLHNIPEGLAVGIVFAGVLSGEVMMSVAGAFVLCIGLAIQNFPEGAIISMPLKANGMSKFKAFGYGVLSGVVEPIASLLAILLVSLVEPILPYFLSFAAGAMIYVVVDELIPNSHNGKHSNLSVIGVAIGFLLMMVLDVALG